MGKLVVTVTHPTERQDNTPFNPAVDLHHWLLFARAIGASTWTPVGGENGPDVTVREINNVPLGGDWEARAEWYDQHGQMSFAIASTDVPDPIPAPPKPGTVQAVYVP